MKRSYRVQALFLGLLLFATALTAGRQTYAQAADYKYLIKVNREQNVVTVYTKDKAGNYTVPYKAMICSTGSANTPLGTFRTPVRYRWRALVGNVWGQYSTRIHGSILFHSVQYDRQNPATLLAEEYNRLGEGVSHGCIRLTVQDAKWIYDNCPIGTTVIIYDDKDPGPLGKPEAPKIDEDSVYDPTDIWTEENPYNRKLPELEVDKSFLVKQGSTIDLLEGVKAAASYGEDISRYIEVTGTVDTDTAGIYGVTYRVTDLCGRNASYKVYYRVLE